MMEQFEPIPGGVLGLHDQRGMDMDVVSAARISFNYIPGTEIRKEDKELIRYLIQNSHGSPFEHNMFRWYVEAPIFVFREWHRHRVGWSYNEMSGRYTKLEKRFYVPASDAVRQRVGKPGRYTYETHPMGERVQYMLQANYDDAWRDYENLLAMNVAPEQARLVLPVATFSKMWATCNARSLMHFLSLRTHPTAQAEIRAYADQMEKLFAKFMPVTHKCWVEAGRKPV
jgi:thymidylate synthase (FAD)